MNAPRWYPTVTALPDGNALVIAGTIDAQTNNNQLPQVYQPASNSWRDLTSALKDLPYYPWMFVAPDGRLFNAGPRGRSQFLSTSGTGAWTLSAVSAGGSRPYGSAVMYDEGRVLIVGGGDRPRRRRRPSTCTRPSPHGVRRAACTAAAHGQRHAAAGRHGAGDGRQRRRGLRQLWRGGEAAELWDPASGQWTVLAPEERYRGYHSTALLLPDGRVLSAGGRMKEPTAQVFSPPYLFRGARPPSPPRRTRSPGGTPSPCRRRTRTPSPR